jgi:DNA-binding MarR family transcriptional regulator
VKSLHDLRVEGAAHKAVARLFQLGVLLSQGMDRELAKLGLSRARAEVIWTLHRGGPITQRELSEALRCTPRNVTGLIDALEELRLVARRRHPNDRRATLVGLTEAGMNVAESWDAGYRQLARDLFGDSSEEEVEGLLRALDRIVARLRPSEGDS